MPSAAYSAFYIQTIAVTNAFAISTIISLLLLNYFICSCRTSAREM